MPIYRVKPGKHHGAQAQYIPGDLVNYTEDEAAGFLDKLELVIAEEPQAEPKVESKPSSKGKGKKTEAKAEEPQAEPKVE